jgi:hypothetical protein
METLVASLYGLTAAMILFNISVSFFPKALGARAIRYVTMLAVFATGLVLLVLDGWRLVVIWLGIGAVTAVIDTACEIWKPSSPVNFRGFTVIPILLKGILASILFWPYLLPADLEWFLAKVGLASCEPTLPPTHSLEESLSMPDEELGLALTDHLARIPGDLNPPEQTLWLVTQFQQDVNNGGFQQYLWNSNENLSQVVDALRTVGANRTAELAEEAFAVLGSAYASGGQARRTRIEEPTEEQKATWLSLDDKFFDSDEEITALVARFTLDHGSELMKAEARRSQITGSTS